MAHYTMPKVLHLADKNWAFGIDKGEWETGDTTICNLVRQAIINGWMEQGGESDTQYLFCLTLNGEIKHHENRLTWRRSQGLDESGVSMKLCELKARRVKEDKRNAN